MAGLGAPVESGIDLVLELIGFADELRAAALVITGEGRLDAQSLRGKAIVGILRAAAARDVPVIAVCGVTALSDEAARDIGLMRVVALRDRLGSDDQAISEAAILLEQVGFELRPSIPS